MSSLALKRKRESIESNKTKCFANAGFCSTPKKFVTSQRSSNIGDVKHYAIASNIVHGSDGSHEDERDYETEAASTNPFEVVRKSIRRKKVDPFEEICFENPALNLDLPDRRMNPFEVVRDPVPHTDADGCVNKALNLQNENEDGSAINPSSIHLEKICLTQRADGNTNETRSNYKITLPFAPNIACRIDFTNISLSQISPTAVLNDRIVFSPIAQEAKGTLEAIDEESTISIEKELDRFQLEIENSINEAKVTNGKNEGRKRKWTRPSLMTPQKMDSIVENEKDELENADNLSDKEPEEDSFEENFLKNPRPFQRVYRPAEVNPPVADSQPLKENKNTEKGIRNSIRRSIRKFMDHNGLKTMQTKPDGNTNGDQNDLKAPGLLNTLRRSLRKKKPKPSVNTAANVPAEVSIIDMEKTRIKFKSEGLKMEEASSGVSSKELLKSVLRLKHHHYDLK